MAPKQAVVWPILGGAFVPMHRSGLRGAPLRTRLVADLLCLGIGKGKGLIKGGERKPPDVQGPLCAGITGATSGPPRSRCRVGQG